jgi:hypothetical protein
VKKKKIEGVAMKFCAGAQFLGRKKKKKIVFNIKPEMLLTRVTPSCRDAEIFQMSFCKVVFGGRTTVHALHKRHNNRSYIAVCEMVFIF